MTSIRIPVYTTWRVAVENGAISIFRDARTHVVLDMLADHSSADLPTEVMAEVVKVQRQHREALPINAEIVGYIKGVTIGRPSTVTRFGESSEVTLHIDAGQVEEVQRAARQGRRLKVTFKDC